MKEIKKEKKKKSTIFPIKLLNDLPFLNRKRIEKEFIKE